LNKDTDGDGIPDARDPAPGQAPTLTPTITPSPTPTPTPTPTITPTPMPPAGGVSLNCDNTFQRIQISEAGSLGQTLTVDDWSGSAWESAWIIASGDPMQRQIEDSAGLYQFGGCEQLVVVPLRYTGSGAILELAVFKWNGSGLDQAYSHSGSHGSWEVDGDSLIFERSVYLYGESNCCPCNREVVRYRWTGDEFVELSTDLEPTYSGSPPPYCQVTPGLRLPGIAATLVLDPIIYVTPSP
jgi:hypothetical protein